MTIEDDVVDRLNVLARAVADEFDDDKREKIKAGPVHAALVDAASEISRLRTQLSEVEKERDRLQSLIDTRAVLAKQVSELHAHELKEVRDVAVLAEREHVAKALDIGGEADAIDNLEGALIDLRRTGADKVCIETVERVQRQIAAAIRPRTTPPVSDKAHAADAMHHLGMVLVMLQDLHPDDQCKAWGDAMSFYNAANQDARIEPNEGYSTRLVHSTSLSPPAPTVEELARVISELVEAIDASIDRDTTTPALWKRVDRARAVLSHLKLDRTTRFEVIDENGRSYVRTGISIQLSYQDNGKTLKVFIKQ